MVDLVSRARIHSLITCVGSRSFLPSFLRERHFISLLAAHVVSVAAPPPQICSFHSLTQFPFSPQNCDLPISEDQICPP